MLSLTCLRTAGLAVSVLLNCCCCPGWASTRVGACCQAATRQLERACGRCTGFTHAQADCREACIVHTVPAALSLCCSLSSSLAGYMKAVAEVCRQEGASLLIPVAPPNHSIYDAILIHLLPSGCRSLSLGADLTAMLDDKVSAKSVSFELGLTWALPGIPILISTSPCGLSSTGLSIAAAFSAASCTPLQPPHMSRPEFLWSLAPSQMLCCLMQIKFSEVCNKIGVRVPKMWSITSHDELRKLNVSSDVTNGGARFLLKCVSYDPKHRTDLFTLPATAAALEAYLQVRRPSGCKVLLGHVKPDHHSRRHAQHKPYS